jgi:proline dehydrogenase
MPDRWVLPDRRAALEWCKKRNEQGISCIIDILGRYNREESEAMKACEDHISLLEDISRSGLKASITVKPSTLGGTLHRETTLRLARKICEKAAQLRIPFELDMEGQRMVDLTLEIADDNLRSGLPVTVTVQAYLRRTSQDIDAMLDACARIRLVKGAYSGDVSDFHMIQEAFKDAAEQIIEQDAPFCIGTHDMDLLKWSMNRIPDRDFIEYSFLKGLADETKECMAFEGWKVSEYVPYGKAKEGYETRWRTYLAKLTELGLSPAP